MSARNLAFLVTFLGILSLLVAATCLGLGLYETATIPVEKYKDPAVGYTFAPWFAVVGLALLGMGRAVRRMAADEGPG